MALFTEATIRKRAHDELRKSGLLKKSEQLIVESTAAYSTAKSYDIFLSHGIRDADLILGMKGTLEDLGYIVYVDWIEDPQLDRSRVTPATADKLRQRMNSSKSLFFVTTANTDSSKWMPWECGYFDGKKEKVAIVPILAESYDNSYSGQEYLALYPYAVQQQNRAEKETLYIRRSKSRYTTYNTWVITPNSQVVWQEG
ncbi:MAG: toll-Interleukin receptor [Gallionella sp.]